MLHVDHQPLKIRLADRALLAVLKTLRVLLLPWPMSWRIRFGGWAGLAAGRVSKRRRLALNNLKRAFGAGSTYSRRQLERIVDHSYRDFGRSMAEFLMSESIDASYFTAHVQVENENRLRALADAGKGAVLLTAHFGNWEFLNLMAGVRGHALAVLAKVQKLAATDAYLNRLRTLRGARVVLRGMDVRQVYRTLTAGGLAGVLADQDGGPEGIFAPLFGRQSSYPRGVARFSYKTGSPALPVFTVRESLDRHRIHIGTPVRPETGESEEAFEKRVVAEFSRQLEAMVRLHPSQWLWAHRRWKSSPDRDIVVLDDGRKGHTHQSLALAAQVAARRSQSVMGDGSRAWANAADLTRTRTIEVRYRSGAARGALTLYGMLTRGRLWGGKAWLSWTLTPDSYRALSTAPADTVISCGTSTEAVNLILARDCAARSCYIQKPQFGARYFSTVLVPGHDRVKAGRNTFKTRGALSFVHPERLRQLRERARAEAGIAPGSRAAALLIGGPSKHMAWDPAALEKIFFGLREFSREHKLYLLVTTSRRTDAAVESAVERLFTGEPTCPVIVIPTRANPSHAYEGILAAADLVLVTTDSVSMISEAVATGKPVGLLDPDANPAGRRTGKLGRFLAHLEREGAATRLHAGSLSGFLSRQPSPVRASESADAVLSAADLLAS